MRKSKLITALLLLALVFSLFAGCQAQHADVPTDPSAFSQPTESIEPSSEPTEPSGEATDPTESTVCPRTIEYFKAHLTPNMTYREVLEILGPKDSDFSDSPDWREAVWYLEDDYILVVDFFPTVHQHRHEYLATEPPAETTPDGTVDSGFYLREWNLLMEARFARIFKGNMSLDNREVWFDYGDPWMTEE